MCTCDIIMTLITLALLGGCYIGATWSVKKGYGRIIVPPKDYKYKWSPKDPYYPWEI